MNHISEFEAVILNFDIIYKSNQLVFEVNATHEMILRISAIQKEGKHLVQFMLTGEIGNHVRLFNAVMQ